MDNVKKCTTIILLLSTLGAMQRTVCATKTKLTLVDAKQISLENAFSYSGWFRHKPKYSIRNSYHTCELIRKEFQDKIDQIFAIKDSDERTKAMAVFLNNSIVEYFPCWVDLLDRDETLLAQKMVILKKCLEVYSLPIGQFEKNQLATLDSSRIINLLGKQMLAIYMPCLMSRPELLPRCTAMSNRYVEIVKHLNNAFKEYQASAFFLTHKIPYPLTRAKNEFNSKVGFFYNMSLDDFGDKTSTADTDEKKEEKKS